MKIPFARFVQLTLIGSIQIFLFAGTPQFETFPAGPPFRGRPAKVRLADTKDKEFASQLRWASHKKPNFAGHYVLSSWGCGTSCIMTVAIDAQTGRVVWLPFTVSGWPPDIKEPLEFKRNSSLLIVHGSRDEQGGGTYYYQFDGRQFVPVLEIENPHS